ncbi:MAG: hypothetical protein FJ030_04305 [Chloroflexi bacterium]|nr:hypothetical protein [Chloroflexota bacterium]
MSPDEPTKPSEPQKPETPPHDDAESQTPNSKPQTTQPPNHPATAPRSDSGAGTTHPPSLPVSPKVNLDASGMPLPKRVPERDPEATRAARPAILDKPWNPEASIPTVPHAPTTRPLDHSTTPPSDHPTTRPPHWKRLALNLTLAAFALVAIAIVLAASAAIVEYYRIAQTLPDPDDLSTRAAQFESTYIYDSTGQLLYELNDPNKGRRTRIPIDQISPYLLAATIATEDRDYYNHPGFDAIAILKAVYRAYRYGGELAGASTITQQLTRALYLRLAECDDPDSESSCYELSVDRKIREIILAAEINRRYSKDQILELYLNEIYYGNLAYGIEAAAKTYFNKDAKDLTLAEAAFLAGLPQSPAVYDVFTDPETTFDRQKQVLLLMVEASGDCAQPGAGIPVRIGGEEQRLCVTQSEAAAAIIEIQNHTFIPPVIDAKYPHWVNYVRFILETQFGQELYRAGFRVRTTLNPQLQDLAEAEVKAQVESLAASHVTDGALIALDPNTGAILAMVGSDSYDDPVDGQINMAIRPRQPGSSIKTLTYVAAFEKGWTPSTLIWDVPTKFPDGANPPYEPVNYDGRFHGPVRVRDALANSYNIPAVKALQFVGVYDDPNTPGPDGLIKFAERLGIASLNRNDYGLALTLGGGEVTLLEMTNAYGVLANGGRKIIPVAITRIDSSNGAQVCEQPTDLAAAPTLPPCQAVPGDLGQPIVRAQHAFLISSILSDNHARALAFGPNSALALSFPAAVKTGTTNDYRDNWTIGYTPNLVVGVWVGNADFTEMAQGVSGVTGAGPIWHNVMQNAWEALGAQPESFAQPPGIITANICAATGAAENNYCKNIVDPRRPNEPPVVPEVFAADRPPAPPEKDIVVKLFIDKFSGLRASPECNNDTSNTEEKTFVTIADPFALTWLETNEQGRQWAERLGVTFPITPPPTEFCNPNAARPVAAIVSPSEFQTLDGLVPVYGVADIANGEFDHYIVDWGIGYDPQGWGGVSGEVRNPVKDAGLLAQWDTANVPDVEATLRLTVFDKQGNSKEARVRVIIQHPATETPIPSTDTPVPPTLTPTDTPSATPTLAATDTPTATDTLTAQPATATPTDTPTASDTPTATETTPPAP